MITAVASAFVWVVVCLQWRAAFVSSSTMENVKERSSKTVLH